MEVFTTALRKRWRGLSTGGTGTRRARSPGERDRPYAESFLSGFQKNRALRVFSSSGRPEPELVSGQHGWVCFGRRKSDESQNLAVACWRCFGNACVRRRTRRVCGGTVTDPTGQAIAGGTVKELKNEHETCERSVVRMSPEICNQFDRSLLRYRNVISQRLQGIGSHGVVVRRRSFSRWTYKPSNCGSRPLMQFRFTEVLPSVESLEASKRSGDCYSRNLSDLHAIGAQPFLSRILKLITSLAVGIRDLTAPGQSGSSKISIGPPQAVGARGPRGARRAGTTNRGTQLLIDNVPDNRQHERRRRSFLHRATQEGRSRRNTYD